MLRRAIAHREGLEEVPGFSVEDILMSREKMTLVLRNGSRYSIDRGSASFIDELTPDDDVVIYRSTAENRIYVIWPSLLHQLPLSSFTKETQLPPRPLTPAPEK